MNLRRLLSRAWMLAGVVGQAGPVATFECREFVGRDWARTLVTYQQEFPAGALRVDAAVLTDAGGNPLPVQLSRVRQYADGSVSSARVSFFAELPKGGSYRYLLQAGEPAAGAPPPRIETDGGLTTLDNGMVAVRLPATGDVKFELPLRMGADHAEMLAAYGQQVARGVVPGPIQGIRLSDGRWIGGSYFFAPAPDAAPKVTGYTCRITEQGPLFAEAGIRYTFSNGGWYGLTARVLAGDPAVRIDEQFDMGQPGPMWDYRVMISLTGGWEDGGWKPDVAYWISAEERLKGRDQAFQAKLREAGLPAPDDCGSTAITYDEPFKHVFDVAVRYPWHSNAQFFGLARTADLSRDLIASGRAPFLAVVPMHAGNWRGSIDPSDGMLFSYQVGDLCLNWRLRASPHPRNMLHTGEYDPDQPLTFCRRQWALVGGPFQPFEKLWSFRAQEGHITLDDYKDWMLDWPADPAITYPRLLFGRADADRLKTQMDRLPAADQFRRFLYVHHSDARQQELWKKLSRGGEWDSPGGMTRHLMSRGDPANIPWAVGYRVSQMTGWAGDMDELLSSERLTPDQRRQLRSDIAALCYTLSEPDLNPRGAMTHLGNPNMPINRFCGLAWAAALIPDHPMSGTWLDVASQYLRYKLAMNTAPGGAWGELISYYDASAPHLIQTAGVLARTGRMDDRTARLAVDPALFTLNLLTPPDPRFGARLIPGWGHEGMPQGIQFLMAANAVRTIDPALAASFVWAWDAMGRPMGGHHDAGFSPRAQANAELLGTLPPGFVPPQLASTWLPGLGAAMRAHAGHPNETYLSFRQGYQVSHSDANQGDFTLYAAGAPLVPLSLDGYAIHGDKPFARLFNTFGFHSRVRFGQQSNTGGWPGGGALGGAPAHAFSSSVDYVRGVSDEGPQRWNRQIALLKSKSPAQPSYFVFRDSFAPLAAPAALQPKWWYLRTLGHREQVKAAEAGFDYESEFSPRLQVRFLEPLKVEVESREATHRTPLYHVNAANWRRTNAAAGQDGDLSIEDTITVNAVGPIAAGQNVTVVLYPHVEGQAPPRSEPLASGAARITTSESVDYVFLDCPGRNLAVDDVSFDGVAGAVRLFPDEVHLVISEGPARVTYQGTTLRSEGPAVQVLARADAAKKQEIQLPSPWRLKETDLPPGCRIEGPARCELLVSPDRIVGRSEGFGGLLYAPMPPGMKVLPTLIIDGQTYAPGTSGDTLIIPLLPGEHRLEVRALEQPPVFRNWQAWE